MPPKSKSKKSTRKRGIWSRVNRRLKRIGGGNFSYPISQGRIGTGGRPYYITQEVPRYIHVPVYKNAGTGFNPANEDHMNVVSAFDEDYDPVHSKTPKPKRAAQKVEGMDIDIEPVRGKATKPRRMVGVRVQMPPSKVRREPVVPISEPPPPATPPPPPATPPPPPATPPRSTEEVATPSALTIAEGHEAHMRKLEDARVIRVERKRVAEQPPPILSSFRTEMQKFRYRGRMEDLERAPTERQKRRKDEQAEINQQLKDAIHRLQSSTHVAKVEARSGLGAHQLPAHKLVIPPEGDGYQIGGQWGKEKAKAWEVNLYRKEKRDKTRMRESVARQIKKDTEFTEFQRFTDRRRRAHKPKEPPLPADLNDEEWAAYQQSERVAVRAIEKKIGKWKPSDQRSATEHVAYSKYLLQGAGTGSNFIWA